MELGVHGTTPQASAVVRVDDLLAELLREAEPRGARPPKGCSRGRAHVRNLPRAARSQRNRRSFQRALTRLAAGHIDWPMRTRLLRLSKATVAVLLLASFAAWHPVMMTAMAAMQHAAHHARGSGAPQPPSTPFHCCDLCPLACAAAVGVPGVTPLAVAFHAAVQHVDPLPDADRWVQVAPPHRLPFSIGPPSLREA